MYRQTLTYTADAMKKSLRNFMRDNIDDVLDARDLLLETNAWFIDEWRARTAGGPSSYDVDEYLYKPVAIYLDSLFGKFRNSKKEHIELWLMTYDD